MVITFLKKKRDLFIYMASFVSRPIGLNILSDPAKSTNIAFLLLKLPFSSSSYKVIVNMEWLLEDKSFILFWATILFFAPLFHSDIKFCISAHVIS
jgi:hypothetical protein